MRDSFTFLLPLPTLFPPFVSTLCSLLCCRRCNRHNTPVRTTLYYTLYLCLHATRCLSLPPKPAVFCLCRFLPFCSRSLGRSLARHSFVCLVRSRHVSHTTFDSPRQSSAARLSQLASIREQGESRLIKSSINFYGEIDRIDYQKAIGVRKAEEQQLLLNSSQFRVSESTVPIPHQ